MRAAGHSAPITLDATGGGVTAIITESQKAGDTSPRGISRANGLRARAGHADEIVCVYERLSRNGEHLMGAVLDGGAPVRWRHYPDDDARDRAGRFQWYYHSHSPKDRPKTTEHGHIHLFAVAASCGDKINEAAERRFQRRFNEAPGSAATRHLVAIGFNAVGVPTSLFTVNSWVTGDRLLSGRNTLALLNGIQLNTGYDDIDRLISGVLGLCAPLLPRLLRDRDNRLRDRCRRGPGALDDKSLEVLSEVSFDLDARIRTTMSRMQTADC